MKRVQLPRLAPSAEARQGAVAVGVVFFTSTCSYFVTPILAVLLVERGAPGVLSGTLIGMQLFIGRVSTPITGWLSDRIGARWLVTSGIALTGFAHLGLAHAHSILQLTGLVFLLGLAMALFGPASKSLAVHSIQDGKVRSRIFAWRNMASHGGMAVGAMIGTYLLAETGKVAILRGAAAIELLIVVIALLLLPKEKATVSPPAFSRIGAILKQPQMWVTLLVISCYWAVYIQLSVAAPLTIDYVGVPEMLGPMFATNAVAVLFLQIPLMRQVERWEITPRQSLIAGHLMFGASLCVLGTTENWSGAPVLFSLLIALGVVLGAPAIDTWVTELAGEGEVGTFLGIGFLAMGIGSGMGGTVGGWAASLAASSEIHSSLIWLTLALALSAPLVLITRSSKKI